jgi:3-phenylpropionate/trans-cinnamate dioxygenase ferredoxin reductase subunit
MDRYRYLIVGGGMAADAAVQGIRSVDTEGGIGIVGAEDDPPYDRPPLSKGLWKDMAEDKVWRATADRGATLHLGRRIVGLDLSAKTAVDDRGQTYGFERMLLATGGTPRRLGVDGDEDVICFRTMADYRRLRQLAAQHERFAVVGGSFIGSEIAAALAINGKKVTMVIPRIAICANLFPAGLARSVTEVYRQRGVEVRSLERAMRLDRRDGRTVLTTRAVGADTSSRITVDVVVAGVGIHPNTDLAESAGVDVGNGILVDRRARTSHPDIFAAGDVASFTNPATGARIRFEHEDNANTMGKIAGRNMAGEATAYDHLPFFYSDLFDLGYEAVGVIDAGLETFEDWRQPYREGVVYYLRDGRVQGVLLWNVWDQVAKATELVLAQEKVRPEDLRGRLPA